MSLGYVSADGWIRHFDGQVEAALRAALLKKQEEEEERRRREEEEQQRSQLQEQPPLRRRIQRAVRIICFDCHRFLHPNHFTKI
jgi:hypothetical protein